MLWGITQKSPLAREDVLLEACLIADWLRLRAGEKAEILEKRKKHPSHSTIPEAETVSLFVMYLKFQFIYCPFCIFFL